MTIAQELDAFLHRHNTDAKEAAQTSLYVACILWPISLVAVLLFGGRMVLRCFIAVDPGASWGLLTWAGLFVISFVLFNAGFALLLVSQKYEHEPVAEASEPGEASLASLALSFFMLPARMTADAMTRRRAVVVLAEEERQSAEALLMHLKQEGTPIPWRKELVSPQLLSRLVKIKAVRLEDDRYGNPVLSRRLPPDPLEAFDRH